MQLHTQYTFVLPINTHLHCTTRCSFMVIYFQVYCKLFHTRRMFIQQRSDWLTSLRFQIFTSHCLCWLLSFKKLTSIVAYLVDSVGKKAHILFNILIVEKKKGYKISNSYLVSFIFIWKYTYTVFADCLDVVWFFFFVEVFGSLSLHCWGPI